MILDLHIHSKYSFDSLSKPKDIVRVAKKKGLNGIGITDHNTIKGSIEAKTFNDDQNFLVIIGSEIATDIGDIIGLFLNDEIKSRRGIDVIEEIHGQGGISILPHPYKSHKINEEIIKKIDAIEGFNSRTCEEDNRKATELARFYNKPIVAGSDAHFLSEIGSSKIIVDSENIRDGILNANIKLTTSKTPLYIQSLSQIIKSIKSNEYNKVPRQLISVMREIISG